MKVLIVLRQELLPIFVIYFDAKIVIWQKDIICMSVPSIFLCEYAKTVHKDHLSLVIFDIN